jgi:hypothetical protein
MWSGVLTSLADLGLFKEAEAAVAAVVVGGGEGGDEVELARRGQ